MLYSPGCGGVDTLELGAWRLVSSLVNTDLIGRVGVYWLQWAMSDGAPDALHST